MHRLPTAALCLFLSLLGACQSYRQIPALDPANSASFAGQTPTDGSVQFSKLDLQGLKQEGALRFRMQDRLQMSIWGYPELSHIAEVQANGKVTLPLVGEVQAAGRTAAEIRNEVESRLEFLSRPANPELRYGDVVTLFVWQHPEAAFSAVVQPDGTVTLPLTGTISVVDRPLPDLNAELKQRLSAYVRDPHAWLIPQISQRNVILDPVVSILPVELTERKATVLGEVFAPGRQVLAPDTRVLDALAAAQPSDLGDLNNVILIRNYNAESPEYRRLAMREYLSGEAPLQNIYLQEGDILFVPKTGIAKLGHIIDQFFARTRPFFDWYLTAASAINYKEDRDLNRRLNNAAIEAFESGFVPPSLPKPD